MTDGRKNEYAAFYKGRRVDVFADTTFEAQKAAAKLLRARKYYDVFVILVTKSNGETVVHRAVD